jgi:nucleoside-diphosphate-sugar epimerase
MTTDPSTVADDNKNEEASAGNSGNGNGTSILILGGCGFIGRHLLQYFVTMGGFNITVADKLIPQTAYMTKDTIALYKLENVKLIQSDLSKDHHIRKVFAEDRVYDYIINLCGETRMGQTVADIQLKSVDTAKKCIEAASHLSSLKKWIEVSTAQVYEPKKKPLKENAKIAPFSKIAVARYEVEQLLGATKLPYVILRPSIVYGTGDKSGLTPRLICAACYKHCNETMTLLWGKNLAMHTVHVGDVCTAIWTACQKANTGSVYNVSDKGNTTAGAFNVLLHKIFGIKCNFHNAVVNALARRMVSQISAVSNNKHVPMWNEICKTFNITQSPLTPYMDIEILKENYLSVDGSKIEEELAFVYQYPLVTQEALEAVIAEFVAQEYFPDFSKANNNNNNSDN